MYNKIHLLKFTTWWILIDVYGCVTTTRDTSIPWKAVCSHCPSSTTSPCNHLIFCRYVLSCLKIYTVFSLLYLASLTMLIFIHADCISSQFLLIVELVMQFGYITTVRSFYQLLGIVNKAVRIYMKVFVWTYVFIFLGYISGSGIAEWHGKCILTF
jgi:hypothetical protein